MLLHVVDRILRAMEPEEIKKYFGHTGVFQ